MVFGRVLGGLRLGVHASRSARVFVAKPTRARVNALPYVSVCAHGLALAPVLRRMAPGSTSVLLRCALFR